MEVTLPAVPAPGEVSSQLQPARQYLTQPHEPIGNANDNIHADLIIAIGDALRASTTRRRASGVARSSAPHTQRFALMEFSYDKPNVAGILCASCWDRAHLVRW